MDAISYEYTKPRKQFGLHPTFADSQANATTLASIPSLPSTGNAPIVPPHSINSSITTSFTSPLNSTTNASSVASGTPSSSSTSASSSSSLSSNTSINETNQWLSSLTSTVDLSCIPSLACHEVNTERYVSYQKGTSHTEGAWPSEIKTNEFVDRQRYVRRLLNEPVYQAAIVNLTKVAETVIMQNNTIDCYQQYFPPSNELSTADNSIENTTAAAAAINTEEYHSTPPSAKTIAVFRDPNKLKSSLRTATKLSWHPDGASKIAAAYSSTTFQSQTIDTPLLSYIWDVSCPNHPDAKLIPTNSSCLTTLAFNPRSPDHLVGGCYNGTLSFYDLRKGATAIDSSLLERSHHDPVYDVYWIQSRTGNECCSLSTDGQLLWWDIRKLKKGYSDSMQLEAENGIKYGGMSMEYKSDAGATRFLVGTEQGISLLIDRKAKKDSESTKSIKSTYGLSLSGTSHHGPIYSIQRNPFNLKYFLTVGDWSSKIWMEDLKTPLIISHYDYSNNYLTSGQWSPTRPGLFYTSKSNGTIDIWDLYYSQSNSIYTIKVSDTEISTMKIHSSGKLLGIGDKSGSVTIVSVSKGLYELQRDEKSIIASLFERETKREKNLEIKRIQASREKKEKEKKEENAKRAALASANSNEEKEQIIINTANTNNNFSSTGSIIIPNTNRDNPLQMTIKEEEELKEILKKAEEDFFIAIENKGEENRLGSSGNNNLNNNNINGTEGWDEKENDMEEKENSNEKELEEAKVTYSSISYEIRS